MSEFGVRTCPRCLSSLPSYPADCNRATIGNDCGCKTCRAAYYLTQDRHAKRYVPADPPPLVEPMIVILPADVSADVAESVRRQIAAYTRGMIERDRLERRRG